MSIPLAANGQSSWFINAAFTGIALELDAVNQIFATLPVVPVPERISRE